MTAPPTPDTAGLARPWAHADEADVLALLRSQAHRFVTRAVDSAAIDRDGHTPPAVLSAAAEAGLFGLTVPESYGGAGLSLKAACAVVDDLAAHDRAVAIAVGLHAGLGSHPLVTVGDGAQRDRYLPPMARGACIAAFAATEAGAGSDLTAVTTTATVDGDALRLCGEKCYVTNGGVAGVITVLARTPGLGGARAFSLLCLPLDTPGVVVGPEEHKLGIRGASTVTVRFDDVALPGSALLGPPGRGMDLAHAALARGRTIMSAGCVGTARAALALTLAQVQTRRQFGRPLRAFTAVQTQVAEMAASVFAMESLVRCVGEREAARESIDGLSMAAKVYCSEASWAVCDRAVQLHGALGYIEATGVARLLRDGRITRIFEGANDVLLLRGGLGLLTERTPQPLLGEAVPAGLLGAAAAHDRLARGLDATLGVARKAHGVGIVQRQVLLQRLARAWVCLIAARASVQRATESARARDLALADVAAQQLCADGARHLDDSARAEGDEARAAALQGWLFDDAREDGR